VVSLRSSAPTAEDAVGVVVGGVQDIDVGADLPAEHGRQVLAVLIAAIRSSSASAARAQLLDPASSMKLAK
jgi:hypothetical protein